jgi:hypothetical protein
MTQVSFVNEFLFQKLKVVKQNEESTLFVFHQGFALNCLG